MMCVLRSLDVIDVTGGDCGEWKRIKQRRGKSGGIECSPLNAYVRDFSYIPFVVIFKQKSS